MIAMATNTTPACVDVTALHSTMQRRWNNASEMYREAHKNQAIKDLYSNLNHLNKLTSQLEYLRGAIADNGKTRVAYTTQGEPTSAIVRDKYAVIDHKAFQTECQNQRGGPLRNCHPQQQPVGVPSQTILHHQLGQENQGLPQARLEATNPALRR